MSIKDIQRMLGIRDRTTELDCYVPLSPNVLPQSIKPRFTGIRGAVKQAFLQKTMRATAKSTGANNGFRLGLVINDGEPFWSDWLRGDENGLVTTDIPCEISCEIGSDGTIHIPQSGTIHFIINYAVVQDPDDPSTTQSVSIESEWV